MQPHPPSAAKITTNASAGVRRRSVKFPGKGESLKKKTPDATQKRNIRSSPKKPVNFVVVNEATERKYHSAVALENNLSGENLDHKIASVDHSSSVARQDSFSKYRPLPDIKKKQIKTETTKMRKSASSNKRVPFPNGQLEENTMNIPPDEMFLKSMKKMKLRSEHGQNINNQHFHVQSEPQSNVNLIIRTPNGSKLQNIFLSTSTINDILTFLTKQMKTDINLRKYVLYTNEVPKRELTGKTSSLSTLGIKDRTVLTLDTRDW